MLALYSLSLTVVALVLPVLSLPTKADKGWSIQPAWADRAGESVNFHIENYDQPNAEVYPRQTYWRSVLNGKMQDAGRDEWGRPGLPMFGRPTWIAKKNEEGENHLIEYGVRWGKGVGDVPIMVM